MKIVISDEFAMKVATAVFIPVALANEAANKTVAKSRRIGEKLATAYNNPKRTRTAIINKLTNK